MKKECVCCIHAKRDHTGNWYCPFTRCVCGGDEK